MLCSKLSDCLIDLRFGFRSFTIECQNAESVGGFNCSGFLQTESPSANNRALITAGIGPSQVDPKIIRSGSTFGNGNRKPGRYPPWVPCSRTSFGCIITKQTNLPPTALLQTPQVLLFSQPHRCIASVHLRSVGSLVDRMINQLSRSFQIQFSSN